MVAEFVSRQSGSPINGETACLNSNMPATHTMAHSGGHGAPHGGPHDAHGPLTVPLTHPGHHGGPPDREVKMKLDRLASEVASLQSIFRLGKPVAAAAAAAAADGLVTGHSAATVSGP
ncbi:hypothetical protein ALC56_01272 [Trachymyrmex septentrionalis]|uniref:Uncharacterized protein n=1 Tax=Trachymyrmex septentrionalis TaxID=34720 RepID=A0A195FV48_9HYME|nr:hypothetical protein ALC56_01272 [Trachymyrmex septentrionalis]